MRSTTTKVGSRKTPRRQPFDLAGQTVEAGSRQTLSLPFGLLSTHAPMDLPIHVVHGKKDGPVMFVSAAVHGDEVIGVEIIRRLLALPSMKRLRGTLIAAPIVNVYGFIAHSRYLPDRRDLNRSFPGTAKGSLAGQLANLFTQEVLAKCTHGIDIHSGAFHRDNLPQVRADLSNDEMSRLARAFGAPVILKSDLRQGSLREAAASRGMPVLLYEAGEALRFNETAIRAGVRGVLGVMHAIGMLPGRAPRVKADPIVCRSSSWVRAPASGVFRAVTGLGAAVGPEALLGVISDPFGENEWPVLAPTEGLVIGRTNLPVVNQGDALFHVARVSDQEAAGELVEQFQEEVDDSALMDEPPIV